MELTADCYLILFFLLVCIKIMSNACINRVKKELDMLANDPGPGISAWPFCDDNMMILQVIHY